MALTIGLDLGDKHSQLCVLDESGQVVEEAKIASTPQALDRRFRGTSPALVALEAGTHSGWVRSTLEDCGHQVLVANPRRLPLISQSDSKSDRHDAEWLARLARLEPKLLAPIQLRSRQAQHDLAMLRSRSVLVRTRTQLVNHVRGLVKSSGGRLKKCSTMTFHKQVVPQIPPELSAALAPIVATIETLTHRLQDFDERIAAMVAEKYPEASLLQQVSGVGILTSATFVLTIADPHRFRSSRSLGAYLGLRPRRRQSGNIEPQLRIAKSGDADLRRLLVTSAHYVLGPFGPDCDLRRWGLSRLTPGDKNAKKRAVVAVARKLAVLLHHLWITAEVYEPFRHGKTQEAAAQRLSA